MNECQIYFGTKVEELVDGSVLRDEKRDIKSNFWDYLT